MIQRLRSYLVEWLDRRTRMARRRDGEALFLGYRRRRRDAITARSYYEACVGLWRERSESAGYLSALLEGLEHCPAPRTVVDVGTGVGASAAAVAARHPAASVVGVDGSRRMIRAARAAHASPGLTFVRADYRHLSFADSSVHLVCMLNAVGDPAEIRRILAPGASMLLASSFFFEIPPEAWFARWRSLGFQPVEAAAVGGGHWELYMAPGATPTRSSPGASMRRRARPD